MSADGTPWDGTSKPHSATTGMPVTTALADAVQMFPTPTASMVTMADMEQARYAGNKGGKRPSYKAAMAMFPTPTAGNDHSGGTIQEWGGKGNPFRTGDEFRGSLNPDWVEWLMNWPVGWTRLKDFSVSQLLYWDFATIQNQHLPGFWFEEEIGAELDGEFFIKVSIPRLGEKLENRSKRLKCIGNGQVPAAMVLAWDILSGEISD